MMFAIRPSFPAGAGGTITVWASSDGVHYHGEVTGLAPGSVHTIHDHAGTCVGGPRSTHLAVLSTASADSHGTLTFDAALPLIDFGPERIVLVYQTGRPTVIAGCATL